MNSGALKVEARRPRNTRATPKGGKRSGHGRDQRDWFSESCTILL